MHASGLNPEMSAEAEPSLSACADRSEFGGDVCDLEIGRSGYFVPCSGRLAGARGGHLRPGPSRVACEKFGLIDPLEVYLLVFL